MIARNPNIVDGLRERERLAADLLARGKTCREVARALGIAEKTLYNWRKRPAVQRAIYNMQQELIDSNESRHVALMPEAIKTLTDIMNDPNARASDRCLPGAQTARAHGVRPGVPDLRRPRAQG
jgi:uncharacterized protein (UPF0147 family)